MSLPSSKFYTTKEVAAFEGVTEDYLRKQVSKGEFIKPTHLGRPHRCLRFGLTTTTSTILLT